MKKIIFLLLITLFFVSCSDNKSEVVISEEVIEEETPDIEEVPEPPVVTPIDPEPDPTKTEISYLTGLPCTPEEKVARPIAVMINNNKVSYPQESVSLADVIYECDMEGGVTRLMALFSSWSDIGNIGSMRSARDYFIDLSVAHDAIYVHAGGSPSAYTAIVETGIDNIDGVNMYTIPEDTFWRDRDRIKQCGYEHSMLTSGEKISTAVSSLKYRIEYSKGFSRAYSFKDEFSVPETDSFAEKLTLVHSDYITVEFMYDVMNKKYLKRSFGAPHVDGSNEEQLAFENVVVLFVSEKVIDSEGRLSIDLTGEGKGYYLTGGKKVDITWQRQSEGTLFSLYADGEQLLFNPGKTHITLFNKNRKDYVIIN